MENSIWKKDKKHILKTFQRSTATCPEATERYLGRYSATFMQ